MSFVVGSGLSEVPAAQSFNDPGDIFSSIDIGSLSMDDFEQAVEDIMAI